MCDEVLERLAGLVLGSSHGTSVADAVEIISNLHREWGRAVEVGSHALSQLGPKTCRCCRIDTARWWAIGVKDLEETLKTATTLRNASSERSQRIGASPLPQTYRPHQQTRQ